MQPPTDQLTSARDVTDSRGASAGGLHQRMVGASGQRLYTFFLKDESIHEIEAIDGETALEKLGDKLGKPKWLYRYWLLEDIKICLTPI